MRVETVRGAMAVDGLGTTLMHEHVFVLTPDVMQNYGHEWWDEQDRGADAVRQLQVLKDAGVDSIVDPTVVAWAATSRGCIGSTSRWTYKTGLLPRWNYTHITDDVLPALRENGVDEAQITGDVGPHPRPLLHRRPGVSPTAVIEISRTHNPYPRQGVQADDYGIPRYTELPESLIAMLARHVETGPDVEAVVEVGGQRLAYQQLWDRAARVAGGLRAAGVARGDRVAVRYPAGVNWVLAFWGTLMAGGVAVAVNTRSSRPEVEFVLQDAGVTVDLAADSPLPDGDPLVVDGLGHSDVAAFFYTSGTTGNPKGVPTTHEAFLTNGENMLTCLGLPADIGAGLRTLISVPLFHVTGCNSQLLVAARIGGTSVILPAFDQAKMIASVPGERITYLVTVPAIYSLILRRPEFATTDVSAVRWVGYGGSPIAPTLVQALQDAFPAARVFNGYGMTETASIMSVLPHDDAVEHADSVGYPVPSVDLGIVPLDDDPSTGELVVRGANVTAGYWQRPETNAETIVDGWLHTGDIVRVDDAGRVHIVDRIKDIIILGGENVSSIEVESALLAAPGVAEAAVIAVPDDVMGEKVGAVLFGGAETVDVQQVLAHCREQLADFKVPQYIVVSGRPLPRNPGGKLLKAQLRKSVEWGAPL